MYIARTAQATVGSVIGVRFYILDEKNNYKLVKGVQMNFPTGTVQNTIDSSVAQAVLNTYQSVKGATAVTLAQAKSLTLQPFNASVFSTNLP